MKAAGKLHLTVFYHSPPKHQGSFEPSDTSGRAESSKQKIKSIGLPDKNDSFISRHLHVLQGRYEQRSVDRWLNLSLLPLPACLSWYQRASYHGSGGPDQTAPLKTDGSAQPTRTAPLGSAKSYSRSI